ncbi:MAG: exopolysaccharide biosynthesis protein [Bacteroidales bacterium]
MDILSQIVKLLLRIKYWLLFLPLIAALIAIYLTRNMPRQYVVTTTIYTGIASGFTIESGVGGGRIDWSSVNNGIDNLISIIKSKTTLRNVSLRLYTQHMIYGDPLKDNNYILASNYRNLLLITPKEVRALIDKTSEEKTIENLNAYERASPTNFVYGLFNWNHQHYSYNALSKIEVRRLFDSDMLDITYSNDDPGITYNTLALLNDEFVKQYEILRFGETNNVVEYFRNELAKLSRKLRASEDSLTQYYIEKKVINYDEQTKQVTALSRDYDLLYNDALLRYTSASTTVNDLEERIKEQIKMIQNNSLFLDKLNTLSQYSTAVARLETFQTDSLSTNSKTLEEYKRRLKEAENDLKSFSALVSDQKYTKEGIATTTFVEQWIAEIIVREKAISEMKVMEEVKKTLEDQYTYFSPIGTTLKRKERDIGFTTESYLTVLQSLNAALLRQKTLQMTSATLKAINPPLFPVSPMPTARRIIVLITYIGTLIFIIGYFLLLELFDRTVRDKIRAERLIPAIVLGAFPTRNRFKYRGYNKEYERIAANYLANAIIPYLNPKEKPDIINFISTDEGTGKSLLIDHLNEYWTERGLRVRIISWHEGITSDSRDYILSMNLSELYDYENEDVILVEHRSISKSAIPVGLLREASINLVVIRADKVWRDIDKLAFERLKTQAQDAPLQLYLTQASTSVEESFVGMLPPYSYFRKLVYKLTQFGLTSK